MTSNTLNESPSPRSLAFMDPLWPCGGFSLDFEVTGQLSQGDTSLQETGPVAFETMHTHRKGE